MPHNIERSAFHHGEWCGYGGGAVYRIKRRQGGGWVANRTVNGFSDAGAPFLYGRTLEAIARKLPA